MKNPILIALFLAILASAGCAPQSFRTNETFVALMAYAEAHDATLPENWEELSKWAGSNSVEFDSSDAKALSEYSIVARKAIDSTGRSEPYVLKGEESDLFTATLNRDLHLAMNDLQGRFILGQKK